MATRARYTKPSAELQCFDPNKYASFEECCTTPGICIAPTAKGNRCSWTITAQDRLKAAQHLLQAGICSNNVDRQLEIARFVILHCCKKQHRWRLEGEGNACLERIVEMYEAATLVIGLDPVHAHKATAASTLNSHEVSVTIPENSTQGEEVLPEQVAGMALRSGTIVKSLSETLQLHCMKSDYFIPYESDPTDDVRGELSKPIPDDWADEGEVYSFQWPEYSDFVKIGFSAWSAEERVEEWRICNPDATLSRAVFVDYPKRLERLVHLELAQYRYRIRICRECSHSHEEYFKLSIDEVDQVINDWATLVRREHLYRFDGQLTESWCSRIRNVHGNITARILHGVLDIEAAYVQQTRADSLESARDPASVPAHAEEHDDTQDGEEEPDLEFLTELISMAAIADTCTASDEG